MIGSTLYTTLAHSRTVRATPEREHRPEVPDLDVILKAHVLTRSLRAPRSWSTDAHSRF